MNINTNIQTILSWNINKKWYGIGPRYSGKISCWYATSDRLKSSDFGDFVVQVAKIKENEKIDKYLDLAWELKSYGTWKWW